MVYVTRPLNFFNIGPIFHKTVSETPTSSWSVVRKKGGRPSTLQIDATPESPGLKSHSMWKRYVMTNKDKLNLKSYTSP